MSFITTRNNVERNNSGLNFSNRSKIGQAPRQHRSRDACHISEQYDHCNIQSRGLHASRDLPIRPRSQKRPWSVTNPKAAIYGRLWYSSLYHIKTVLNVLWWKSKKKYRKTSHISRTLVGNKIVDNSDVVGASPVGAAPTTSSLSTQHLASMDWAKTPARGFK